MRYTFTSVAIQRYNIPLVATIETAALPFQGILLVYNAKSGLPVDKRTITDTVGQLELDLHAAAMAPAKHGNTVTDALRAARLLLVLNEYTSLGFEVHQPRTFGLDD